MTNWTEVEDVKTNWGSGQRGYRLTTLDGRILTTQDERYLTREGVTTDFSEVGDSTERYIPFGVGLKIATEEFNWILTEDKQVRMVHSRTNYSEVEDVITDYIKVEDA